MAEVGVGVAGGKGAGEVVARVEPSEGGYLERAGGAGWWWRGRSTRRRSHGYFGPDCLWAIAFGAVGVFGAVCFKGFRVGGCGNDEREGACEEEKQEKEGLHRWVGREVGAREMESCKGCQLQEGDG